MHLIAWHGKRDDEIMAAFYWSPLFGQILSNIGHLSNCIKCVPTIAFWFKQKYHTYMSSWPEPHIYTVNDRTLVMFLPKVPYTHRYVYGSGQP
jgi:hypothetical protein